MSTFTKSEISYQGKCHKKCQCNEPEILTLKHLKFEELLMDLRQEFKESILEVIAKTTWLLQTSADLLFLTLCSAHSETMSPMKTMQRANQHIS